MTAAVTTSALLRREREHGSRRPSQPEAAAAASGIILAELIPSSESQNAFAKLQAGRGGLRNCNLPSYSAVEKPPKRWLAFSATLLHGTAPKLQWVFRYSVVKRQSVVGHFLALAGGPHRFAAGGEVPAAAPATARLSRWVKNVDMHILPLDG